MRTWQIWSGTKSWHYTNPQHQVIEFVGEEIGTWNLEQNPLVTFYVYQTEEGKVIIQKLVKAERPGGVHTSQVWEFSNIEEAGRKAATVLYNLESNHPAVSEWRRRWLNS
jgi:hypothetical protein